MVSIFIDSKNRLQSDLHKQNVRYYCAIDLPFQNQLCRNGGFVTELLQGTEPMKVGVTSTGLKLDDPVGIRPDKCSYWLVVDPATMEYEAIPNPLINLGGPAAGKLLAQLLKEHMVKFVLAGGCGCNQLKELGEYGIRVLLGMTGSVRETIEKFNRSQFPGMR